jgi:hypothetical protein
MTLTVGKKEDSATGEAKGIGDGDGEGDEEEDGLEEEEKDEGCGDREGTGDGDCGWGEGDGDGEELREGDNERLRLCFGPMHTFFLQYRTGASYCLIRSALLLTKGG